MVVEAAGDFRLRSLTIHDGAANRTEEVPAAAVFIMIGASPRTGWLPANIERDDRGYVVTDRSVGADFAGGRPPSALATTVSGIFAVGDVRAGSIKRVAAAVGEGSTVIRMVHEYLASRGVTSGASTDSVATKQ